MLRICHFRSFVMEFYLARFGYEDYSIGHQFGAHKTGWYNCNSIQLPAIIHSFISIPFIPIPFYWIILLFLLFILQIHFLACWRFQWKTNRPFIQSQNPGQLNSFKFIIFLVCRKMLINLRIEIFPQTLIHCNVWQQIFQHFFWVKFLVRISQAFHLI